MFPLEPGKLYSFNPIVEGTTIVPISYNRKQSRQLFEKNQQFMFLKMKNNGTLDVYYFLAPDGKTYTFSEGGLADFFYIK